MPLNGSLQLLFYFTSAQDDTCFSVSGSLVPGHRPCVLTFLLCSSVDFSLFPSLPILTHVPSSPSLIWGAHVIIMDLFLNLGWTEYEQEI